MTMCSPLIARRRLALALAVTASLAVADAAHAYTFPLGAESCNFPNNVLAVMDAPSGVFADSSSKNCHELCKHVVRDCKQYVSDAASCTLALVSDYGFFQKHGCNEFQTGQSRKDCLASVGSYVSDQKATIKSERDGFLSMCTDWGATCEGSCPP